VCGCECAELSNYSNRVWSETLAGASIFTDTAA
jgi:hypothetical protein